MFACWDFYSDSSSYLRDIWLSRCRGLGVSPSASYQAERCVIQGMTFIKVFTEQGQRIVTCPENCFKTSLPRSNKLLKDFL